MQNMYCEKYEAYVTLKNVHVKVFIVLDLCCAIVRDHIRISLLT